MIVTPTGDEASTFENKIKYFTEKKTELIKLNAELQNKAETYKAEMKAWCGITEGEQADVIGILKAVKKVLAGA